MTSWHPEGGEPRRDTPSSPQAEQPHWGAPQPGWSQQPEWSQQPPMEPMPGWAPNDPYGMPPQRTGPNGMAIAALALGVIGIFLFNIILGPLAIIFGSIGLRRANRGGSGRGMAIAGLALGIFDIVIWLIVVIAVTRNLGYTI